MSSSTTIAKNTLFLYLRMFFTMGVSLYTSRVILNTLGIEDYGIYSIVGGVITSLSFLSSTIVSANSRFISYAIGKNDRPHLRKTFSLANTSNIIILCVVFILCEIIGVWWVNHKLVIPSDKLYLANIIFQLSLISTLLSLLSSTFSALIISYERMKFFAVSQMVQVILRLIVVIFLPFISFNPTISYVVFLLLINFVFFVYYIFYCKRNFECTNFHLNFSKDLKEIFSFSFWDLYGNFAVTMRTQGIAIMQNLFFGVGINAAIGIASQVQSAVSSFASNILIASKPQIIKSFAKNDFENMNNLIIKTTKYSLLFLCVIIIPLIVEIDFVIRLWLGIIPKYVLSLIVWFLLFVIIANISSCVMMGIHATGKIKKSSIINGSLYLIVLPISYLLFKHYSKPEIPYIINVAMVIVGANLNMVYLKQYVSSFSIKKIYYEAIIPTALLSLSNYLILKLLTSVLDDNFLRLILVVLVSTVFMVGVSWVFILEKEAKQFLIKKIWK